MAEQGFANEPVGGCPANSGPAVDQQEITRIVQSVVAELKRRGAV